MYSNRKLAYMCTVGYKRDINTENSKITIRDKRRPETE